MEKELILDNGKIRNCTHNHAIMTHWQHLKADRFWLGALLEVRRDLSWDTTIGEVLQLLVIIVIFPVIPFLRAYYTKKHAIAAVAKEEDFKAETYKAREENKNH